MRLSRAFVCYGGAQALFGIEPDMTTLGKIIGGGMPLAAYGGKAEIMDKVSPQGPVYQAGTLSGNPIATTAGIETLRILKAHPEYYTQIDESAKQIAQALRNWAKEKKKTVTGQSDWFAVVCVSYRYAGCGL